MKVLFTENYKTSMREVIEDTYKCTNNLCALIARLNIVKMSTLP